MTTQHHDVRHHRVVLVDDTRDLRELMRLAMVRGGFDVVGEAADGREGIEVCAKQQPDVVLLDLAMPVMDGIEALPGIREHCPTAVIVVLSGFGAQQMAARAVAAGADGYVQKGAPLKKILAYVRDLTDGETPRPARALSLVRQEDRTPPSAPAPPQPGPGSVASRVPAFAEVAAWTHASVTMAPYGVVAVADDDEQRLLHLNPVARRHLDHPADGAVLATVSPGLAALVAFHRASPQATYDVDGPLGRLRVDQRRAGQSIMLFLDAAPEEALLLRRAIATAAHEIRGPVTVLSGVAETIVDMEDMAVEDRLRMMRSVARQTRLLDGITADLLTAAQIQRGTLRFDIQVLDPAAVVAAVVRDDFDATVRVLDGRWISADPLRLEQMLTNLLRNAVKYGEPPIEVVLRPAERDGWLCIDVIDHGTGVPPAFQQRLFTEFARADAAGRVHGTGLGLFVVRTLAEGQHGSVGYAPGEGGGAVFTIALPVATLAPTDSPDT